MSNEYHKSSRGNLNENRRENDVELETERRTGRQYYELIYTILNEDMPHDEKQRWLQDHVAALPFSDEEKQRVKNGVNARLESNAKLFQSYGEKPEQKLQALLGAIGAEDSFREQLSQGDFVVHEHIPGVYEIALPSEDFHDLYRLIRTKGFPPQGLAVRTQDIDFLITQQGYNDSENRPHELHHVVWSILFS